MRRGVGLLVLTGCLLAACGDAPPHHADDVAVAGPAMFAELRRIVEARDADGMWALVSERMRAEGRREMGRRLEKARARPKRARKLQEELGLEEGTKIVEIPRADRIAANAFSPDGTQLLARWPIARYDVASGAVRRRHEARGFEEAAAWHPDGRRLVVFARSFQREGEPDPGDRLHVYDAVE